MIAVAGMAFLVSAPAYADSLPSDYLGFWCFSQRGSNFEIALAKKNIQVSERRQTDEKCPSDEFIKIGLKGYEIPAPDALAQEEDDHGATSSCKFISVKFWKKATVIWVHVPVPIFRTVAQCTREGDTWIEKREVMYYKDEFQDQTLSGQLFTKSLSKGP
jgi:hypothetical protein